MLPKTFASLARTLLLALLALGFSRAPAGAFVFDSFGDGFWRITNRANGSQLIVNSVGASQSASTAMEIERHFQLLYNLESDTFRIRSRDTWQCLEAKNAATTAGTAVVEGANYTAAAHQRWKFVDVGTGNGDYRIINVLSNLALQTDVGAPASVTLAAQAADTKQYWRFEYQTHYPKKGSAGYENDWSRYGASWNYSWGKFTNPTLPPQVVFEPMQHSRWWDGSPENLAADSAQFRVSAKPVYMLGFNEPDHTDQANMSVADVIALWPYFQDAKLPLVSPVAANAFGGWLGDFYTQVASKGYRVDFTAVHWYGYPDASALINHLQSVYNTWGRPVWLTEFANIDWSNNRNWTEEDCYRFLAEFMWRAEDLIWLKRYSIFTDKGNHSGNPWDYNGEMSWIFQGDGTTFTPFGELYAAWDGDRTIRARQPYLINNKAITQRMTSPGGTTPGVAWIRDSGATTQWVLVASSTSGRYYIQSLLNGRRLRYNGTTLDLAPPGTTGSDLEWSYNADTNGYYFIDLPSRGKTLRMDGGATPGVTVENSGTASDNTRFRFIKPYAPVRGAGVVARYTFDGNVLDSGTEGNNGAVFNNVTYTTGKVGAQAAQFDGTSSFVRLPASVKTDFSIAFWMKTTATGGAGTQWWSGLGLVDGEVSGAAEDFGTSLVGNKVAFGCGNGDTTIVSTTVVNDGAWHHVCATRTKAGAMQLFVDGVSQGTANGPTWDRFGPAMLRVGALLSGTNFYTGAIDDVRIFSYAMPGSNVNALYNPAAAPWLEADIGGPNCEGYATFGGTTWTVGGGGADIWTTADQFHFLHQAATGDKAIVARITLLPLNVDNTTTANSKAGVMFRDSTATGAPFVLLTYDQSQGIQMLYRDTAGAAAAQQGASFATSAAPFWLKLVRVGNSFTAYRATTTGTPAASDWIQVATHTTTMSSSALAGLAVTSHDNGLVARAGFADVQIGAANTAPTISNVADQTLTENGATGLLPVTIGDAETVAASLVLTATSSNQTLVPNANIALGGSSANRTVQITPAANQAGTATITLTVSDGQLSAADALTLTVQTTPGGTWRQQYFGSTANSGNAADGADPDRDGFTNLWERAFALNPNSADLGMWPSLGSDPTFLTLTYRKSLAASDLSFQVVWSSDLLNWSATGVTDALISADAAKETRVGKVPKSTGDPLFLRLRITAP